MEHFISHYGYVALIILTISEAACIPVPSEVTIGMAGYLASTGRLNLAAVIILGTVGEIIGSGIGYAIGRFGGRALVDRYGKYALLSGKDLDRAEKFFDGKGEFGILIGRIVPFVRTFISIPAGAAEMQLGRFFVFTAIGSAIWITALGCIADSLGNRWSKLTHGFSLAGYALAGVAILAIAAFLAHRWKSLRSEREGQSQLPS